MPSVPMNERNIVFFPVQSAQIDTDEEENPIYDNMADAEILQNLRKLEIKDGIYPDNSTYLKVEKHGDGDGDMYVVVKAGFAHIQGVQIWVKNDVVLEVDPAYDLLDRVDRVVLRYVVDDRDVTLAIKTGDTSLTRTNQIWELGLADLHVDHMNSVVTQEEIDDLRLDTAACGIVSGLMQVDTAEIFAQYQAWWDSQQSTTGFLSVGAENPSLNTEDKTVLGAINELDAQISNPNLLINGDFQVWQRGTSFPTTASAIYTADRWISGQGHGYVQRLGVYSGINIDSQIFDGAFGPSQIMEFPTTYSGKTVTFSANFKTDHPVIMYIRADSVSVETASFDNTDYEDHFITVTLPTIVSSLKVGFYFPTHDTSLQCKWCKLEYGSTPTTFYPRSYDEELFRCQRFYEVSQELPLVVYYAGIIQGHSFKVEKRATPTIGFNKLQTIQGTALDPVSIFGASTRGFIGIYMDPPQSVDQWCYVKYIADAELSW